MISLNKETIFEKSFKNSTDELSSLNLISLIDKYVKNKNYAELVFSFIVDKHIIDEAKYLEYHKKFWKIDPKPEHEKLIDRQELINKIALASDDKYIQFTFTGDKVVDDFNYEIVSKHIFNPYVSCFSVDLIRFILNDSDYSGLYFTKGIKNFPKGSSDKYEGDYVMAILIYKDKEGNKQYIDIVDDPTIYKRP